MKKVKFIKKSLYGEKGEEREVTDRAAEGYVKAGIAEYVGTEVKEDKAPAETKEEKQVTKAEKKQVKITKAPKI